MGRFGEKHHISALIGRLMDKEVSVRVLAHDGLIRLARNHHGMSPDFYVISTRTNKPFAPHAGTARVLYAYDAYDTPRRRRHFQRQWRKWHASAR